MRPGALGGSLSGRSVHSILVVLMLVWILPGVVPGQTHTPPSPALPRCDLPVGAFNGFAQFEDGTGGQPPGLFLLLAGRPNLQAAFLQVMSSDLRTDLKAIAFLGQ